MLAGSASHRRAHGWRPALAGLALAAAITLYNWNHKGNPLGPLVMGLCRVLVLVGAGVAATRWHRHARCGSAPRCCCVI